MRIVIGVDGSEASKVACEFVAGRSWPTGTRVNLLGAIETVVDLTGLAALQPSLVADRRAALEAALDERADELRQGGLAVETNVQAGAAAPLLIELATDTLADLIVVGSRRLGPAASALLGSVSAHLVDHAGCPVLVVRSPSAGRMLLATDGATSSANLPRVLAAWGNAFRGLTVEVLSVAPREGFVTPWATAHADDDLVLHEGIAQQVAEEMIELGWHAAAVARAGDPSREIVETAGEFGADLIVTGSRGIGALHRLLAGSVAHEVLLHARSSVLVVRGQVPARVRQVETVGRAYA